MSVPDQLVAYARKIAVYRAYANLENGLQPLSVLNVKLEQEQEEFADALANKDIWHQYHEAADLLYYSACIDCQARNNHVRYNRCLVRISAYHLDQGKAENASLAKYGWRASDFNRKDEEVEIELIRNACQEDRRQKGSPFFL